MVDYTPSGGNVAEGTVLLLGTVTGNTAGTGAMAVVAHRPIVNNTLGAVSVGGGVYAMVNLNNAANGTKVYWEDTFTRNPPQEVTEGARTIYLIVQVYNDGTTGILGSEIKTMQDKILVADVVGRSPREKSILQILDDNGGMVRLAVQ
jgi:hypothetical protein